MPTIDFGSRNEANEFRDRIDEYRASSDDKRTTSLELKSSTPDRIVERLETEAFATQKADSQTRGMTQLSGQERQSLSRQHDTFDWQSYGFEAMRAKGALEEKGATEWQDYYEPGEGVGGALQNLRGTKQRAASSGASIGVGGDYTDEEEQSGLRRRQRQAEQAQAGQVRSAKTPAFRGDDEAIGFLEEEQRFDDDLFDISFRGGQPSGRDYEELQDAHEARSRQAQTVDERRSAEQTTDPLEWAANKDTMDFPGIDTIEPSRLHEQRSERAQEADESELAPIARSEEQWVSNPDQYDWPGVDTPDGFSQDMSFDEVDDAGFDVNLGFNDDDGLF